MEEATPFGGRGLYYVGRIIDKSLLKNNMSDGIYIQFGTIIEQ